MSGRAAPSRSAPPPAAVRRSRLESTTLKRRSKRRPPLRSVALRVGRFLVEGWIFRVFAALFVLGLVVGFATRPAPEAIPWGDLFDQMRVVSYRESPADTSARFVVELTAGGRVFAEYDVDARRFVPPPRGRTYSRAITAATYEPLHVRGHVGYGFWLDIPRTSARPLLPEELKELYRSTLDLVKPFSLLTNVLGIVSGYSIGYRVATWGTSLWSGRVQERVLATPGLGRTLAGEAWRRVLLEPVVMAGDNDLARFAAVHGAHRLYAAFFKVAIDDSNGFIPREAERLVAHGRPAEARVMRAFAGAVRRAASGEPHMTSADFSAVERWASLLERRGHWAAGTIPETGEERERYLGTLAWYGLAPPGPDADRVWVGPRMLVRAGDVDGFVADEIPATAVGCPATWREPIAERRTHVAAAASALFADRPEFPALAAFGVRLLRGVEATGRHFGGRLAALWDRPQSATQAASSRPPDGHGPLAQQPVAGARVEDVDRVPFTPSPRAGAGVDSTPRRAVAYPARTMGTRATVILVVSDSAAGVGAAAAAHAAFAFTDSLMSHRIEASEVARLNREGGSGVSAVHPEVAQVLDAALAVWRESAGAFDVTVEPLVRAWGFIGGSPRVPRAAEADSALALVGSQHLTFDAQGRTLRFARPGMKIDVGGIASGHAVDRAAARLAAAGIRDALVNLSGHVAALGQPAPGEPWRIGVRDPRDRMRHFATFALGAGEAAATSDRDEQFVAADGRTYGHVVDPRTGRSAEGLTSVTVIAPTAMLADAWSTALFVLGPAEAKRIARAREDLAVVLIEPGADGVDTAWVESGVLRRFALEPAAAGRFRVAPF